MKRFLYLLIQFTWGICQTIIGFGFFLVNIRCSHKSYRNAIETRWKNPIMGLSLGPFIFTPSSQNEEDYKKVRVHEYGHTFQSLVLGPFYAVVGIISTSWGMLIHPILRKVRKEEPKYTECFVEYNASWLGEKITGEEAYW